MGLRHRKVLWMGLWPGGPWPRRSAALPLSQPGACTSNVTIVPEALQDQEPGRRPRAAPTARSSAPERGAEAWWGPSLLALPPCRLRPVARQSTSQDRGWHCSGSRRVAMAGEPVAAAQGAPLRSRAGGGEVAAVGRALLRRVSPQMPTLPPASAGQVTPPRTSGGPHPAQQSPQGCHTHFLSSPSSWVPVPKGTSLWQVLSDVDRGGAGAPEGSPAQGTPPPRGTWGQRGQAGCGRRPRDPHQPPFRAPF